MLKYLPTFVAVTVAVGVRDWVEFRYGTTWSWIAAALTLIVVLLVVDVAIKKRKRAAFARRERQQDAAEDT